MFGKDGNTRTLCVHPSPAWASVNVYVNRVVGNKSSQTSTNNSKNMWIKKVETRAYVPRVNANAVLLWEPFYDGGEILFSSFLFEFS